LKLYRGKRRKELEGNGENGFTVLGMRNGKSPGG